MEVTEKVNRAYRQDKEQRVRQEAPRKNRIRLMPFRQFTRRKQSLTEAVLAVDVVDALTLVVPAGVTNAEKTWAVGELADALLRLAQMGDVTVTAIATAPEGELTQ